MKRGNMPENTMPEVTSESWEVVNETHLEEVLAFAAQSGRAHTLHQSFDVINRIATNFQGKIALMPDFAPYSFYFDVRNDRGRVMNGGIIFHGKHDGGGNGGAPTFSVCLTPTDGWTVHT
jgi:hypothetical protein